MADKMKECLKDHSNQGCAGTVTGDGRRGRDNDTINRSRPRVAYGWCRTGGLSHLSLSVCEQHLQSM